MSLKKDLQKHYDRLDKFRQNLAAAEARDDDEAAAKIKMEINQLSKTLSGLKSQQSVQTENKADILKALGFSRGLTKPEQSDLGKLKKSVRGLVVVHPTSALGRELALKVMTGYAPSEY